MSRSGGAPRGNIVDLDPQVELRIYKSDVPDAAHKKLPTRFVEEIKKENFDDTLIHDIIEAAKHEWKIVDTVTVDLLNCEGSVIDSAAQLHKQIATATTGDIHLILGVRSEAGEFIYHDKFRTDARLYSRQPSAKTEIQGGAGYTALSIVAEIIDNSIQYTKDNALLSHDNPSLASRRPDSSDRLIKVSISPNELRIHNNGRGMDQNGVQTWARLATPVYHEISPPQAARGDTDELRFGASALPFRFSDQHFTSVMSRFGVGSNFALATIGDRNVHLRTRELGKNMTLRTDYVAGVWEGTIYSVPVSRDDAEQFVEVFTNNLRPEYFPGPVGTSEEYIALLKRHLGHIYFYYLAGPEMFETAVSALTVKPATQAEAQSRPNSNQIFSGKSRVDPIKLLVNDTLVDWKDSQEFKYLKKAVSSFPLHFSFTSELSPEELEDHPSWPKMIRHDVYGAVFYYAARKGDETHPDIVARKGGRGRKEKPQQEKKQDDFLMNPQQVEVFWNGKLFDGSNLPPLPFMDHNRVAKDPSLSKYHSLEPEVFKDRVKAMVFFTRRFPPSKHKWQLMSASPVFHKFLDMTKSPKLLEAYCEWLHDCRSRFDNEIVWGAVEVEKASESQPGHFVAQFKSVTVGNTTFQKKDYVSFKLPKVGDVNGCIKTLEREGPRRGIAGLKQRAIITVDWGIKLEEIIVDLREASLSRIDKTAADAWVKQRRVDCPTKIALLPTTNFKSRIQAATDQVIDVQLAAASKRPSELIWYTRVGKLRLRVCPFNVNWQQNIPASKIVFQCEADVEKKTARPTPESLHYHFDYSIVSPGKYALRIDAPDILAEILSPLDLELTVLSGTPTRAVWQDSSKIVLESTLDTPIPPESLYFRLQDVKGGFLQLSDFEFRQARFVPPRGTSIAGTLTAAIVAIDLENNFLFLARGDLSCDPSADDESVGIVSTLVFEGKLPGDGPLEIDLGLEITLKRDRSSAVESPIVLRLPQGLRVIRLSAGPPKKLSVHMNGKKLELGQPFFSYANGDEIQVRCQVFDAFGNISRIPSLDNAPTKRHLAILSNTLSITQYAIDSGTVDGVFAIDSSLFQPTGSLHQPPLAPDMAYNPQMGRPFLESYQAPSGEVFFVGDCVELKGKGYKCIIEAILAPKDPNSVPSLWIRYFTRWKDPQIKAFLAGHGAWAESQSLRNDELLLTDWAVVQGHLASSIHKKIAVFSKESYFKILRSRGVDPSASPQNLHLPDVYFCSKLATYSAGEKYIERIFIMDDDAVVKTIPPLPTSTRNCTVIFWAQRKLHTCALPDSNAELLPWMQKIISQTEAPQMTQQFGALERLNFSVNSHCLFPSATASNYPSLQSGCVVICQPFRCMLDEYNDVLRFALVSSEAPVAPPPVPGTHPKRVVTHFVETRLKILPSSQPRFLRMSLTAGPPDSSLIWTAGANAGYRLNCRPGIPLSIRATLQSEGLDVVTGVAGTIFFNDQEIPISPTGEVEFQIEMPTTSQRKEVKFVASNQRQLQQHISIFVDFSVLLGPPNLVVLSQTQHQIQSGQELALEVQLQDSFGNQTYTPEVVSSLSFAYQTAGGDLHVSPCPTLLVVAEYKQAHRWRVTLPAIFAKSGSHSLSILGAYKNSQGEQIFIPEPAVAVIHVSPGPPACLGTPNLVAGIQVRTKDYLPEILVQVFDHEDPLYRNLVPMNGDITVKIHPSSSSWLHPAITSTEPIKMISGQCILAGAAYQVTSGHLQRATFTFTHKTPNSRRSLETSVQVMILPSENTPVALAMVEPDISVVSQNRFVEPLASGSCLPKFLIEIISETNSIMDASLFLQHLTMKILRKSSGSPPQLVDTVVPISKAGPDSLHKALFIPSDPSKFSRAGEYLLEIMLQTEESPQHLPSLKINFTVRPGVVRSVEVLSAQELTSDTLYIDQPVLIEYLLRDGSGNIVSPSSEVLEVLLVNLPPDLTAALKLETHDRPSRSGSDVGRLEITIKRATAQTSLPHDGIAYADLKFRLDSPEELEPSSVHIRIHLQSASRFQELRSRRRGLDQSVADSRRELARLAALKTQLRSTLVNLRNKEIAINQVDQAERARVDAERQRRAQEVHLLRESRASVPSDTLAAKAAEWANPKRGLLGALAHLFFVDHSADELGGEIDGQHPAHLLNISISNRLGRDMTSLILDPFIPTSPAHASECRSLSWKLIDEIQSKYGNNYDYNWILVCDLPNHNWRELQGAGREEMVTGRDWPDYSNVAGCLGYAVNLVKLTPLAQEMHLRARLLIPLLGKTLVFRTEQHLQAFSISSGTRAAICLDNPYKVTKQGRVETRRGPNSWRNYRGPLFGVRPLEQRSFMVQAITTRNDSTSQRQQLELEMREANTALADAEQQMQLITAELEARELEVSAIDAQLAQAGPAASANEENLTAAPNSKRQKRS